MLGLALKFKIINCIQKNADLLLGYSSLLLWIFGRSKLKKTLKIGVFLGNFVKPYLEKMKMMMFDSY